VINDEKREWTDSPKHQESQTQQNCDLVHITSMPKNAHEMDFLFTLASFLQQAPSNSKNLTAKSVLHRSSMVLHRRL
jgi:hypothetical protein